MLSKVTNATSAFTELVKCGQALAVTVVQPDKTLYPVESASNESMFTFLPQSLSVPPTKTGKVRILLLQPVLLYRFPIKKKFKHLTGY